MVGPAQARLFGQNTNPGFVEDGKRSVVGRYVTAVLAAVGSVCQQTELVSSQRTQGSGDRSGYIVKKFQRVFSSPHRLIFASLCSCVSQ